jgi:hypothetical protein
MMNLISMVALLNMRHWLEDAWRNFARLWQVRRSEGRLQRLHRKVRRLERKCTSLQRRMHLNPGQDGGANFKTAVDADWC